MEFNGEPNDIRSKKLMSNYMVINVSSSILELVEFKSQLTEFPPQKKPTGFNGTLMAL